MKAWKTASTIEFQAARPDGTDWGQTRSQDANEDDEVILLLTSVQVRLLGMFSYSEQANHGKGLRDY